MSKDNNAKDLSEETPKDNGVSAETVDAADSAALIASLTAERDALAREKGEYYDQLLRRTAEFENFRRRTLRERTEFAEYAGMEVVRELLPVLDDFERALKAPSADPEFVKGMELIYHRLMDTLKKMGVEPIAAEGRKFDPNIHHAVEMAPAEDVEDHTILQELRRGYNFKGRLLRPSMVKVAVKA